MLGDSRSSHHSSARHLGAFGLALMLCACATSPQGRQKITTPAPISDVYSDAEMRLNLATTPSIQVPCIKEECELNHAFDQQVQQIGARIVSAAYDAHPDLIHRISHFQFEVAEKKEPGITSNASGKIVILRGTQQIGLNEEALSFVIAREMGHVISQHHDENTTTRILLSVAAGLLFPALNLFGNTAAIAQATSASSATMATTAASTATSYLGSKLVLKSLKPEQLSEADQVALDLLERMGWSHQDIAEALESSAAFEPSNTWSEEFCFSIAQVRSLESASNDIEPLPENPLFTSDSAPLETPAPQAALVDAAGNPLPALEENHEVAFDMPVDSVSVTTSSFVASTPPVLPATKRKWSSQPLKTAKNKVTSRLEKSPSKPARITAHKMAKTSSVRLKMAESGKKGRSGKGATSKSARISDRGRKPVLANRPTLRKQKKPI